MIPSRLSLALLLLLFLIAGCRQEPQLTTSSPDALRAYQQGVLQYDRFYYADAKTLFEQALKADSGFAMAWARLAIVELAIKDEALAREYIDQAALVSEGATDREQLFIRMWQQRLHYNFGAAAATADSLAARFPEEKEVYVFRGNLYEIAKNLDSAIRSYQRAVQADTGYAQAVMMLGYAYSNIGEQEKAIAQMQRYIRLAPEEPDPRASYADILSRAGRYDEALAQYQKSLEIRPDYWYSIREVGRMYTIKGRLKEAELQFHESYKYLPQTRQLEATHFMTDAQFETLRGRHGEAAELYRRASQIDTASLEAVYGLTLSLSRTGRHEEASQLVDRIHEELRRRELLQSPAMGGYFYARSVVLMRQDNFPEALAMCDSAFNSSVPVSRGQVYRQMAEVYLRMKAFEQGLWACEEALAVSPRSPDILLTLTRMYSAKGDRKMTAEIGGRLLKLWEGADPDFEPRREVLRLVGRPV